MTTTDKPPECPPILLSHSDYGVVFDLADDEAEARPVVMGWKRALKLARLINHYAGDRGLDFAGRSKSL